jgi:hypothetical protein
MKKQHDGELVSTMQTAAYRETFVILKQVINDCCLFNGPLSDGFESSTSVRD